MAIYRGAGGSTDTTDQATVTEVSQKAAEAATSATNAASSASEAATSASTASSSKTAAATSATNAASSASTASQKATEATAASTTAVAAQTAVEIMEASVESAESNAILYGNMANTAAGDATTAKNQAEAAATSASTYATAAQTAEANVSANIDAAVASATEAASTSASQASTSASNAATSESNAAASVTAAASSASASAAARDAALEALDSFDDRYLGVKASDPALDNDGNDLVAGALYYNDVDGVMKVYEGSQWVAAYASLSGALLINNNLSDLNNATSARTNLGLGTAATTASTDYATAAQGALADTAYGWGDHAAAGYQAAGDYIVASGDSMTGDLNFGDNDKAVFGAGSDLQIYHDGSHSVIKDNGTGNLRVFAQNFQLYSNADNATMIRGLHDGPIELYYDGTEKLSTTATGVDVTGTIAADAANIAGAITADGLTSAGNILVSQAASNSSITINRTDSLSQFNLTMGQSGTNPFITGNDAQTFSINVDPDNTTTSSSFNIMVDGDAVFTADNNGDISFYEDTGTTAKFFWDASAESLGIGTSSPWGKLQVTASANNGTALATNITDFSDSVVIIHNQDDAGTGNKTGLFFSHAGSPGLLSGIASTKNGGSWQTNLDFYVNNTTGGADTGIIQHAMRIDSSGNVGIGTSSPAQSLDVDGNIIADNFQLKGSDTANNLACTYGYQSGANGSRIVTWGNGTSRSGAVTFDTGNSESMRLDSSGNLLVGTTSTNVHISSTTSGVNIMNNGYIYASKDNDSPMYLNRWASDGGIARFQKDGANMGTIGSVGGSSIYIEGKDFRSGLFFGDGNITPRYNHASSNGTQSLGSSSERFRDLYLSGTAYVGRAIGTVTTDNDMSFNMAATSNFKATPTGSGTLTFTNITAGQSGNIWLDNSGGHAISAAATTYISAADLSKISAAGVYFMSYYSDGTNVMIAVSDALTSAGA